MDGGVEGRQRRRRQRVRARARRASSVVLHSGTRSARQFNRLALGHARPRQLRAAGAPSSRPPVLPSSVGALGPETGLESRISNFEGRGEGGAREGRAREGGTEGGREGGRRTEDVERRRREEGRRIVVGEARGGGRTSNDDGRMSERRTSGEAIEGGRRGRPWLVWPPSPFRASPSWWRRPRPAGEGAAASVSADTDAAAP